MRLYTPMTAIQEVLFAPNAFEQSGPITDANDGYDTPFEPYYPGETPEDRRGLTVVELDSSNRRIDRVLALMRIEPHL